MRESTASACESSVRNSTVSVREFHVHVGDPVLPVRDR